MLGEALLFVPWDVALQAIESLAAHHLGHIPVPCPPEPCNREPCMTIKFAVTVLRILLGQEAC